MLQMDLSLIRKLFLNFTSQGNRKIGSLWTHCIYVRFETAPMVEEMVLELVEFKSLCKAYNKITFKNVTSFRNTVYIVRDI